MKTIRMLHDEWAARIMPKDATAIQRQEMERAFFSGAFAIFLQFVTGVATLPDDRAEAQMAAIEKELEEYFRRFPYHP